MVDSEFKVVAFTGKYCLKVPYSSWYSFFNSPYPGHKYASALDIYFNHSEALLPVDEGRILEVEKFPCPRYRADASDYDYLILIQLDSSTVLKILHVEPSVGCGERVYLGDPLGRMIVSGFFSDWSDLHMHVEVRRASDPYRALGAYPLNISSSIKRLSPISNLSMEFYVDEVKDCLLYTSPSPRDS